MKKFSLFLNVAASALAASLFSAQADPVLLGHKGLAGQTLDAAGVKAVLLGKKASLADSRVVVVIARNNPNQDAFFQEKLGMTADQLQTHWRRLFMTGGGSAPKVVDNEAQACKLAAETPGAITVAGTDKAEGLTVLFTK